MVWSRGNESVGQTASRVRGKGREGGGLERPDRENILITTIQIIGFGEKKQVRALANHIVPSYVSFCIHVGMNRLLCMKQVEEMMGVYLVLAKSLKCSSRE